ncbi:MAG TPA: hypothetical protein VFV23_14395 [Verrucomicrobiae bacterium]|nr:hypothetical protein [Verrucomicrobiae bacterium]
MNKFFRVKFFLFLSIVMAALAVARAQQPEARYDNRVLLVYDTSWAMKARVPKMRAATLELLSTLLQRGELRNGDTIGVWTFSDDVLAGKFPLQTWQANTGETIFSNITRFVADQKYHGSTHFDKLMPMIPGLVENSDRLTVVIFCDGDGHFFGTPFDLPVNGLFQQERSSAHKSAAPFLVILRSQLGKYAGCRVDVPPQMDVPFFPEFPPPPTPPTAPAKTNKPANVIVPPPAPPLLIVGTNIYTGTSALTNRLQSPATKTNLPETTTNSAPARNTNSTEVNSTNIVTITNVVVMTNIVEPQVPAQPPTNPIVSETTLPGEMHTDTALAEKSNSGAGKVYAIAGALCLVGAIGLGMFLLRRSRRTKSSSLITRSMNKK